MVISVIKLSNLQGTVEDLDQYLNRSNEMKGELEDIHLPQGMPRLVGEIEATVLHHAHFISGYSREMRAPVWTGYTLHHSQVHIVYSLYTHVQVCQVHRPSLECVN